jgi:hypothetical protein
MRGTLPTDGSPPPSWEICAFLADAAVHESHYPGKVTKAALTGLGAFLFSIVISYTPIGKHIDRLAGTFPHGEPTASV